MVAVVDSPQRITRLTPLADLLAAIGRLVRPVAPRLVEAVAAAGRTLAGDVAADIARPPSALALRDGWAVASEETGDAGSYAPAILTRTPARVEAGDAMPADTDAVAGLDAMQQTSTGFAALAAVAPGEGVLPEGADAVPGEPLRRTGQVVRRTDVAILRAAGLVALPVREPRIRLATVRSDAILDAAVACLADLAGVDGGVADIAPADAGGLDAALTRAGADMIVIVGGTGTGERDDSVAALARLGRLEHHGIALAPGETAAFGTVGQTPVLLVPGRLDAALAVWLAIGRPIMARLCDRPHQDVAVPRILSRKVASNLGLAELVLLRRDGDGVAPLASGYLPLSALAQADGWILVPPDSEGFAAGARVDMRLLP